MSYPQEFIDELSEDEEKLRKELKHQKYKRCLDKAELCHWKMGVFIYKKEKNDFYYRWYKRWLALADKFKNADKLKDSESGFLAFANPCWMPPVKWMDGKPYYDAEKAVKCIYERMDSLEKRISYLTRLALHALSVCAMGMSMANHYLAKGSRKKQVAYYIFFKKFENLHNIEKDKWRKEKCKK